MASFASNDDDKEPEAKNTLRQAFEAAALPAEIEVYAGAMHGWCPPDSPVHDAEKADRAWGRLVATFGKALGA